MVLKDMSYVQSPAALFVFQLDHDRFSDLADMD